MNPYVNGAEQLPIKLQGNIPLVKNALYIARRHYEKFMPERIHIATEGSMGIAMRQFCRENKINYNTSYHTSLAEYGWVLYGIHKFLTWFYVRWFHRCSSKVLVTTKSIAKQLALKNSVVWGRGVDAELFNPTTRQRIPHERTIITVGRVGKDKNLDDFCKISGYKKIVVGDEPYLKTLKSKYKDVEFTGYIPRIVQHGITGFLGDNIDENIELAFDNLDEISHNALKYAKSQNWQPIADQFVSHLA